MLAEHGDLARADLTLVDRVMRELLANEGHDPARFMLVGAQCRDVWNSALGDAGIATATHDVDIGLAIRTMEEFEGVVEDLEPSGQTGITYAVDGLSVDLMPFGDGVESPPGTVEPPQRVGDPFSVLGFGDAFAAAVDLPLPSGPAIKLATPEGLTALKVAAWHDRLAWHELKDGGDLAVVLRWYTSSSAVRDHLYEEDPPRLLEQAAWVPEVAAAQLWGEQTVRILNEPTRSSLLALWRAAGHRLPEEIARSRLSPHSGELIAQMIEAFDRGLESS